MYSPPMDFFAQARPGAKLPMSVNPRDRLAGMPNDVLSGGEDAFDRKSQLCLDGCITPLGEHSVAGGGYADVRQGSFGNRTVAIKVPRPFTSSGRRIEQSKLLKRLWREYMVWSCLAHPNILEFLGFSYDFCPEPYLVPSLISPWMSNGTVPCYLENSPDADRLALLISMAEGLSYLHAHIPSIVHGDLRAGNVLVSESGVPYLSDFGLSRVLSDVRGMTTSAEIAGSLRWMSPELFHADSRVSIHSDVWAFGMTVLEVLTGERPYAAVKNDIFVLGQINDGHIPPRPKSSMLFTDEIWALCRLCWSRQPTQRPSIREVTSKLYEYRNPTGSTQTYLSPGEPCTSMTPPEGSIVTSFVKRGSMAPQNSLNPDIQSSKSGKELLVEKSSAMSQDAQTPPFTSSPVLAHRKPIAAGSLQNLAGLAGTRGLEAAISALFKFYESLEHIRVCRDHCKQLHKRCVAVLLYLRDNIEIQEPLPETEYSDTIQGAASNIEHISSTVQLWSTWGRARSLIRRSEIKQSLDEMSGELDGWEKRLATGLHEISQPAMALASPGGSRGARPVKTEWTSRSSPRQRSASSFDSSSRGSRMSERLRDPVHQAFIPSSIHLSTTSSASDLACSVKSSTNGSLSPYPASAVSRLEVDSPLSRTSYQSAELELEENFDFDLSDRVSEHSLDILMFRQSPHLRVVGGYADIYEGFLGKQKVAIKTIRPFSTSGEQIKESRLLKRIWREYVAWSSVSHPNVLECLGLSYDFSPKSSHLLSLISPWMSNGTLPSYLEVNPETNRLKLLQGIAEGLSYLHNRRPPIIHGDVRAGNILISDSGVPCLSDFRLSAILSLEMTATASTVVESLRWMSPELLREDSAASSNSDVWAYGMTILEIMSGNRPYQEVNGLLSVFNQIRRGEIPARPQDPKVFLMLNDEVWDVCHHCWTVQPTQRPSMRDVVTRLHSLTQEQSLESSGSQPGRG